MAKNIKQSTQGLSTAATSDCPIRWNSNLEKKLEKLKQPALIQALQITAECRDNDFNHMSIIEMLDDARVNSHLFTEARFPLSMPAIYAAYEQYDLECCEKEEANLDINHPTLGGYIAWLVISKLWRLCDSVSNGATLLHKADRAMEITNICLLAEHAQRICNSQARAIAATSPLNLIWMKAGKEAKRKRVKFWEKAEESFYERYSRDRYMYLSLEEAAMAISETQVLPFDFFQCYQMAQSVEEQI